MLFLSHRKVIKRSDKRCKRERGQEGINKTDKKRKHFVFAALIVKTVQFNLTELDGASRMNVLKQNMPIILQVTAHVADMLKRAGLPVVGTIIQGCVGIASILLNAPVADHCHHKRGVGAVAERKGGEMLRDVSDQVRSGLTKTNKAITEVSWSLPLFKTVKLLCTA